MKKIITIGFLSINLIFLAGCENKQKQPIVQPETMKQVCNKEEDCCTKNEECKYIWYTGGCNTPEYVNEVQKKAEAQGMHIGEAPPRENVTCSCENNKCVTIN